jgi:hypothetical protein
MTLNIREEKVEIVIKEKERIRKKKKEAEVILKQ